MAGSNTCPGGPNAPFFREPIEDTPALLVPTLSLFEVYRHLLRHAGRDEALQVVAAVRQGRVIDLDDRLSLDAAELSVARPYPSLPLPAAKSVSSPKGVTPGPPSRHPPSRRTFPLREAERMKFRLVVGPS